VSAKRSPLLRIVPAAEELTGAAAPLIERAARLAKPGSAEHAGLLFACSAMARYGLVRTTPPNARKDLLQALDTVEVWARAARVAGVAQADAEVKQTPFGSVSRLRSSCFEAMPSLERQTLEAVAKAAQFLPKQRETRLDQHADRVVLRYAALGCYHACAAAILTLDAVSEPPGAMQVVREVAAAVAFQATGLGGARSGEFRAQAWDQAEWEVERRGAFEAHSVESSALQLFHEFLGARWKSLSDSEQAYLTLFCEWALAPASN
jgi:hypothetical protein